MKMTFFKIFLICTFKDPNLVEKLTNLAEHLKKKVELHGVHGFFFPHDFAGGWGQGGADGGQLQDCGNVAWGRGGGVPGKGLSRSWAGYRWLGTSYVNILCDLSLLQTLISRPGWEPGFISGGAVAELQHGEGGAGREGCQQFPISGRRDPPPLL